MKVPSLALLLMASMAFVLTGCSDNSGPVVGPNGQTLAASNSPAALSKTGEGLHQATGTGHWATTPWGNARIRFAFSAIQHANGTTSGELQLNDESGECYFHAKVTELRIEPGQPNMAELIGTIDKGGAGKGAPPYVSTVFVVVVDNGEGKKATGPDMISYIPWFGPGDAEYYGTTVEALLALTPRQFLSWAFDAFQPPGETSFLRPVEYGSVEVK
jgi:hypothetical protein